MAYAQQLLPETDIVGPFNCQGQVNPKVLDILKVAAATGMAGGCPPKAFGHPNQGDSDRHQAVLREWRDKVQIFPNQCNFIFFGPKHGSFTLNLVHIGVSPA